MNALRNLAAFVRLGRPLFLAGGLLLHGLGALMALAAGAALNPRAWLWGQLTVSAAQLMTHYSNEYLDQSADRANHTPTRWAGGSRILVERQLPATVALVAALLFGLAALTAAAMLVWVVRPGPPVLLAALILPAVLLAAGYSLPPLQLHSRGLGEATVAVVVAGLTPLLGYAGQTGGLPGATVLGLWPLLWLQFAMMSTLELPDAEGDADAGKRTLVVRLGRPGAARLIMAALALAYLPLPLLSWLGLPAVVGAFSAGSLPVALWQMWRLARGAANRPAAWDSLSFWGIGLLMGTAGLQALAWLYQLGTGQQPGPLWQGLAALVLFPG